MASFSFRLALFFCRTLWRQSSRSTTPPLLPVQSLKILGNPLTTCLTLAVLTISRDFPTKSLPPLYLAICVIDSPMLPRYYLPSLSSLPLCFHHLLALVGAPLLPLADFLSELKKNCMLPLSWSHFTPGGCKLQA